MKNIVLCGSMTFIDKMKDVSVVLSEMGFVPILPEEGDWSEIKDDDVNEYKRKVSRGHFDKIADSTTQAIFVVNESKNGINNYIGANTFAEIALAFYIGKEIYILNGMYEPYKDELSAWGCRALDGNVQAAAKAYE